MRSTLFRSQHVGDFARARPNRAIGQRAPSSFQGEGDQANLPLEPSFGRSLLQVRWANTPGQPPASRFERSEGVNRERAQHDRRDHGQRTVQRDQMHPRGRPLRRHKRARIEMQPCFRRQFAHGRSPSLHRARYEIRVRAGGKVAPEIVMQTLRPIQITVKNSPPRILRRILLGGI